MSKRKDTTTAAGDAKLSKRLAVESTTNAVWLNTLTSRVVLSLDDVDWLTARLQQAKERSGKWQRNLRMRRLISTR